MQWQKIVLVDSVKDCNTFLKLCICLIVVRHDRGQGAGGEREGEDTNKHENDGHCSFNQILSRYITIPNCSNGSDCKIQ